MDLGLRDQVVVITGGGRGIGAEACQAFAEEGARVVIWDKDRDVAEAVAETVTRSGGVAMVIAASITDSSAVNAALQNIKSQFGTVHVLINNAAANDDSPLIEMTDDQWRRILDVCLTGTFYCSRAVAPLMIEQNYGRIINLASRAHLGEVDKANYCAAKAGILGLTRAMAMELGPHQITVNAIAPGVVRTERVLNTPGYAGLSERARARQLIKRDAVPGDVVNAMLMFASATSGFLTGDLLYVSGGRLS